MNNRKFKIGDPVKTHDGKEGIIMFVDNEESKRNRATEFPYIVDFSNGNGEEWCKIREDVLTLIEQNQPIDEKYNVLESFKIIDKRFKDCETLVEKFDGKNLMSLLLAATYIGQCYEINKPKSK